jgi:hypothetical protein
MTHGALRFTFEADRNRQKKSIVVPKFGPSIKKDFYQDAFDHQPWIEVFYGKDISTAFGDGHYIMLSQKDKR